MIANTRLTARIESGRQQRLARQIARDQSELSTGKRLQAASDDPAAAARVSALARGTADAATWRRNLGSLAAAAAQADTVLAGVASGVGRASELLIAGANATLSDDDRASIAIELDAIADEAAAASLARTNTGEPLFPATATLLVPVGDGLTARASGSAAAVFSGINAAPPDLVAILRDAAAAVRQTGSARAPAIAASLTAVGAADRHLATARAEQGVRGARIDTLADRLEAADLARTEERSGLEDADITSVVTRLQGRQLSLQAAQAAFVRTHQTTLFDLLR